MHTRLTTGSQTLSLARPAIMGVLNVTPDSFSDGGRYTNLADAVVQATQMHSDGADIIDVGGESTRPGAAAVSVDEELQRTLPLVETLVESGLRVSVDTSKPAVMRACVAAGAFMINDVRALREEGALAAAAELNVPVCLMHMLGEPRTMQNNPYYDNVVEDVADFLRNRLDACVNAGVSREHLVVDPGFGFGKSVTHNLCLLRQLSELRALDAPVLVGLSRKSLFGAILDLDVNDRLHASIAAGLMAVERGAAIVRVHDVRATAHALGVHAAVMAATITE